MYISFACSIEAGFPHPQPRLAERINWIRLVAAYTPSLAELGVQVSPWCQISMAGVGAYKLDEITHKDDNLEKFELQSFSSKSTRYSCVAWLADGSQVIAGMRRFRDHRALAVYRYK